MDEYYFVAGTFSDLEPSLRPSYEVYETQHEVGETDDD